MLRHVTFLHTSRSVLGIAAVACTAADIKTGNCTGGDSGRRSGGKGQLTDRWRNKAAGGRPPSEAGAFLAHGSAPSVSVETGRQPGAAVRPPDLPPSCFASVRPFSLPLSFPLLSRSPAFRRSIDRSYQKAERDPRASGRASGGMISKRPDEGERGNGKGARILQAESIPLALRPPSPRWRWLDIK